MLGTTTHAVLCYSVSALESFIKFVLQCKVQLVVPPLSFLCMALSMAQLHGLVLTSHIQLNRTQHPLTGKHFSPVSAFSSKFSIVHIAERAERRNRFCLLIAPAIIIFPQESKTLEKQRLTAPRPLNTAFHIAKNFHRWKTVDKVSKKACIFSIFDPYSCQCPGFGSKFVLLQIVKL